MTKQDRNIVDLAAAKKALGAVQSALNEAKKVFNFISTPIELNDGMLSNTSVLNIFFEAAFKFSESTDPSLAKKINDHANPAAQIILTDKAQQFHSRFKSIYSESFRNLSELTCFSRRRSRDLDGLTDGLQNSLMVRAGVSALSANLVALNVDKDSGLSILKAAFDNLCDVIDDQSLIAAQSLGVSEEQLEARENLAMSTLKDSKNISYIAPLTVPKMAA